MIDSTASGEFGLTKHSQWIRELQSMFRTEMSDLDGGNKCNPER